VWTEEHEKAFQALKTALVTAPVLVHPNLHLPFTILTDASDVAVGGILAQDHGNGLQPVAYYSQALTQTQRNWPVHHRELIALLEALRRWRWADSLINNTAFLTLGLNCVTIRGGAIAVSPGSWVLSDSGGAPVNEACLYTT
jgi:hypothetical protein